nr:hypothetical protein [Tanacetum cinerariifolium]
MYKTSQNTRSKENIIEREESKMWLVLYNEEPNDGVFFRLAHTTLKGSFVTEASGKFMAKAQKELSRKTKAIGGFEPVDHDVEAEIARNIIQKLRPGRVTGHGAGVKNHKTLVDKSLGSGLRQPFLFIIVGTAFAKSLT